jgi:hypothetical protein
MVQRIVRAAVMVWPLAAALAVVAPAQTTEGTATATGVSRDFNPAISLNALFLVSGFPGHEEATSPGSASEAPESGARLQETEFKFTAAIDPYTAADFVFTFEDGEFGIEEGFVSTGVLSHGVGLRAGQMFVPLGHENTLHTHQLPFIERSLFGRDVFGGEALSEFGTEVSWVPATPWFLEVRGAAYNGDDPELFDGAGDWDLAYLTGVDALWDVSEEATFSIGADYLAGPNGNGTNSDTAWSQLFSAVARYKWRSARRARSRGYELLAEYQFAQRDGVPGTPADIARGVYAVAKLQFARRWWVQGRFDLLDPSTQTNTKRGAVLVAFVPSEFGALRFQAGVVDAPGDPYAELHLQYNFTLGSHPAHAY